MSGLSRYKLTRVPQGTAANAQAGGGRIMAISLEGGSDATSVDVFDATSAAGTAIVTMSVGDALSQFYDFTELGGIDCNTGVWVVVTGTAAICYIWTG